MARVGAAAGALLMIPAEQLKQGSQPRLNVPPVSRQVQRGLTRAPFRSEYVVPCAAQNIHHRMRAASAQSTCVGLISWQGQCGLTCMSTPKGLPWGLRDD